MQLVSGKNWQWGVLQDKEMDNDILSNNNFNEVPIKQIQMYTVTTAKKVLFPW